MWGSEKQASYQTLQFSKIRRYVNLGPRLHELCCKLVAATRQLPAQHHRAWHHKRALTKINHKPCPCQGPYGGQRISPQLAPMHLTPAHGAIIQKATRIRHTCKNSIHNVLKVPWCAQYAHRHPTISVQTCVGGDTQHLPSPRRNGHIVKPTF